MGWLAANDAAATTTPASSGGWLAANDATSSGKLALSQFAPSPQELAHQQQVQNNYLTEKNQLQQQQQGAGHVANPAVSDLQAQLRSGMINYDQFIKQFSTASKQQPVQTPSLSSPKDWLTTAPSSAEKIGKQLGGAVRAVARPVIDLASGQGGKATKDTAQLASDLTGGVANDVANKAIQQGSYLFGKTNSQQGIPNATDILAAQKTAKQNLPNTSPATQDMLKNYGGTANGHITVTNMIANGAPDSQVQAFMKQDEAKALAEDKKMLGAGASLASMVVGGGEAKNLATQGIKQGVKAFLPQAVKDAIIGAGGMAGTTLEQNPNATGKELATSAGIGGAGGLVAAGIGNLLGKAAGAGVKDIKPTDINPTEVAPKVESKPVETPAKPLVINGKEVTPTAQDPFAYKDVTPASETLTKVPQTTAETVPKTQQLAETAQPVQTKTTQTAKTAPVDPQVKLKQEALKYKSADEFINAQNIKEQQKFRAGIPENYSQNSGANSKGAGYRAAAQKRALSGQITGTEYRNAEKYLNSNYVGKQIPQGEIVGNSFGNVRVKTLDGSVISVKPENIQVPKVTREQVLSHTQTQGLNNVNTAVAGLDIETKQKLTDLYNQAHTEAKAPAEPTTPVQVTPAEKPAIGTAPADIGKSKVAASTEQKAVEKKLTQGFEGLPEYKKVNVAEQAKAATDLIKSNPEQAIRIAMGHETPPAHVLPESVYTAVENNALKTGNTDLLRRLATESNISSQATGMGQRIRLLAERHPNSPVKAMVDIKEARINAAGGEAKLTPKIQAVAKEIKQNIVKPTKNEWKSFIESLKC